MHVQFRIGRDIEDSEVTSIINISHDAAHAVIACRCIFFSVISNLGFSDDDIADFCILCQVGCNYTDFDDRTTLRDISFFLLNLCIFYYQIGNCRIFFRFWVFSILRGSIKSGKQTP